MKFKITNLGVVEYIEIDFSKPFILLSGNNGTGKTYIASYIYTLVWTLGSYYYSGFKKERIKLPISRVLKSCEKGKIDPDVIYDQVSIFLKDGKENILDHLNLNINSKMFSCTISTTKEEWREEVFNKEVILERNKGILKKKGSFEYTFYKNSLDNIRDSSFCCTTFMLSLIFDGITGAHMFTAERNGIYTFSKEISQSRLRFPEIVKNFSYPRPIADGLANAENLAQFKKYTTQYKDLADEIENHILHGNLVLSDEGEISFMNGDKVLSLNQSSSTIKTLTPIVFYLRHMADDHNLLIIDEPEINLHPDNQVLLAKLFGKMINSGIRLIISTHSDYIIREINNMIMAHSLVASGNQEYLNNQLYSDDFLLDFRDVLPYYFSYNCDGGVKVTNLPIDEEGYNMPSIDATIEDQNERTNYLYSLLNCD